MAQDELREQLKEIQARAEELEAKKALSEKTLKRSKQVEMGFCKVVPFPKVATQPFRSELTIEKHSLFLSNQYKEDHFVREWTTTHPESEEPIEHRVTVGKTDEDSRTWGVLKQIHQDVFYKLLKIWGDQGYPVEGRSPGLTYGTISISAYELVMQLRGNDGAMHYRKVRELLQELMSIPVVIENSYTWQGVEDRQQFTLLSGVYWTDKGVDKKTRRPRKGGESRVAIALSAKVTESFLQQQVKTLLAEPYMALGSGGQGRRGEVARLLYPFLDGQLATKDRFHIRLDGLAQRFGFVLHQKKSYRRRQFVSAVRVLDGKAILGDRYRLRVRLQESEDGTDYVLQARRESSNQLSLPIPLS